MRKSGYTHVLDKGTAKDNEPKVVLKELPSWTQNREVTGLRVLQEEEAVQLNCCWVRKKCHLNTAFALVTPSQESPNCRYAGGKKVKYKL